MKHLKWLLLFVLSLSVYTSFSQTYGMADEFTYDVRGNRIKREYKYTIIAFRMADTTQDSTEIPIDTVKENFTIGGIDGRSKDIRIYPNPVTDQMYIENLSWEANDKAAVKIYDITGKLLYSRQFATAKDLFNLGAFTPGMYQVHYYLNDRFLIMWKVVKN